MVNYAKSVNDMQNARVYDMKCCMDETKNSIHNRLEIKFNVIA